MIIRPMSINDMETIFAIEREAYNAPWNHNMFESELSSNQFAHLFVMEHEGEILGYSGVWIVSDTATITKVTIRSSHRNNGLGQILLTDLLKRVQEAQCEYVSLEVRPSNAFAIALYLKNGFKKVGIRKKYYSNGEDAFAMVKNFKGADYEEVYIGH